MATQEITIENFDSTVKSGSFVVLDFWAGWCRPCMNFAPVFEKVSNEREGIVFGKIDTEAQKELAGGLQISSIPTIMIYRDGIRIYSQPGALREKDFTELLDKAQSVNMDDVRASIAAN